MSIGYSLSIGLNSVDSQHYQGWSGDLIACEFDAADMQTLAAAAGFEHQTVLLTKQATREKVLSELSGLSHRLVDGDTLLTTPSLWGREYPLITFDDVPDIN